MVKMVHVYVKVLFPGSTLISKLSGENCSLFLEVTGALISRSSAVPLGVHGTTLLSC